MDWSFTREVACQTEVSEIEHTQAVEAAVRQLDEAFRHQTTLLQSSYESRVDARIRGFNANVEHQLGRLEQEKTKELSRVRASARTELTNNLIKVNREWELTCQSKVHDLKQHNDQEVQKRNEQILKLKKDVLTRDDELMKARARLIRAYAWIRQKCGDSASTQLQQAIEEDDLPNLVVTLQHELEDREKTIASLRSELAELQKSSGGGGLGRSFGDHSRSRRMSLTSPSVLSIAAAAISTPAERSSSPARATTSTRPGISSVRSATPATSEVAKAAAPEIPQEVVDMEAEISAMRNSVQSEMQANFGQKLERIRLRYENEIHDLRTELEQCQENLAMFQRSFSTMQNPSKLTQIIKRQTNLLEYATKTTAAPQEVLQPTQFLPQLPAQTKAQQPAETTPSSSNNAAQLKRLYRSSAKFQ
ncbi:hypothetical protein RI367_002329 [Sorochytrium milnesiophthora]